MFIFTKYLHLNHTFSCFFAYNNSRLCSLLNAVSYYWKGETLWSRFLKNSSWSSYFADGRFQYLTSFITNLHNSTLILHSSASYYTVLGGIFLKLILLQSGILVTAGQFQGEGSPSNWAIRESCSISLLLLKRGQPVASSIRMHPTLQISTQNLYFLKPKSIQGHLYQRVKPQISYSCPLVHCTADPKSQSAS